MDRRVNVAIIGCGLIGAQWDSPQKRASYALTHAAGFTRNPRSRLVAFCDQDLSKAKSAAERWGCTRVFSDPKSMFAQVQVDLTVVATSSRERWSVIAPALDAGVKYFVIEKPLATTIAECAKLAVALEAADAHTVVNFSRRWDPAMSALRAQIGAGKFGVIQRLMGVYGKGITNNGSHMIDLVSNLFNARPVRVRALGSPLPVSEHTWSRDRESAVDAQVVFSDAAGHEFQLDLLGTDQSAFTCFDLKIIGRSAVCEITQGGRSINIAPIVADSDFPAYWIPGAQTSLPARAMEAMDAMADEAIQLALGRIARSSCDVHTAMVTQIAVDAIKQGAQKEGCWNEIDYANLTCVKR